MTTAVTSLPTTGHATVDGLADEERLNRYVAALDNPDAGITSVASVLHVLATTPVDAVRLQGICERLVSVLHRYDAHASTAPPDAVNEVVRDVLADCQNGDLGCSESVAPWDAFEPYCSARCRSQGEARRP